MFFEEQPWLLIPVIILTVEAWTLAKAFVGRRLADRRARIQA